MNSGCAALYQLCRLGYTEIDSDPPRRFVVGRASAKLCLETRGYRGPAHGSYALYLLRRQYGHEAGYYGCLDACRAGPLLEAEIMGVVEEELRYDDIRAGVDLFREVPEVGLRAACFRMHFGVSAD